MRMRMTSDQIEGVSDHIGDGQSWAVREHDSSRAYGLFVTSGAATEWGDQAFGKLGYVLVKVIGARMLVPANQESDLVAVGKCLGCNESRHAPKVIGNLNAIMGLCPCCSHGHSVHSEFGCTVAGCSCRWPR